MSCRVWGIWGTHISISNTYNIVIIKQAVLRDAVFWLLFLCCFITQICLCFQREPRVAQLQWSLEKAPGTLQASQRSDRCRQDFSARCHIADLLYPCEETWFLQAIDQNSYTDSTAWFHKICIFHVILWYHNNLCCFVFIIL